MIYVVKINDKEYEVEVEKGTASILNISDAAPAAPVAAPAAPAAPVAAPAAPVAGDGEPVPAPMPGTVINVKVSAGASVKKGDLLLILEAMKMENEIFAPRDGVVAQVLASKGASVNTGDALILLK